MIEFTKELMTLINKHSLENDSDTPDFILAEYLTNCLGNFNIATKARKGYGMLFVSKTIQAECTIKCPYCKTDQIQIVKNSLNRSQYKCRECSASSNIFQDANREKVPFWNKKENKVT